MEEMNLKDLYDGNFYHVCTNGLEQVTLLKDDEDFRAAWNCLALSTWRTGVEVVAFTLMSNHVQACKEASQAGSVAKNWVSRENLSVGFFPFDAHGGHFWRPPCDLTRSGRS